MKDIALSLLVSAFVVNLIADEKTRHIQALTMILTGIGSMIVYFTWVTP